MKISKFSFLLLFVWCTLIAAYPLFAADVDTLEDAISQYKKGAYTETLESLRKVLLDSDMAHFHGTAYFYTSKAYIALGLLDNAEKNLEYFLATYRGHQFFPEALYQKGRLLFLQKEYGKAIQVLTDFIETYPNSPYLANSYYWVGESLYSLGKFDQAADMYEVVIEDYPRSYKVEAAKYKKSLIQLEQRERELLTFLKWSHEESLRVIEEFQKREKTYEQALAAYQKKFADLAKEDTSGQISLLNKELQAKEKKIQTLEQRITELENSIKELQNTLKSGDSSVSGTDQTKTIIPDELLVFRNKYLNALVSP